MQLHDRLRAAVEERLKLARRVVPDNGTAEWQIVRDEHGYLHPAVSDMNGIRMANGADRTLDFFAANDPAFVIRACERDLRVLERHPSCDDCDPMSPMDWMHPAACHRCASPWPCEPIRDLAFVYAVDLTEGGQSSGG